MNSADFFVRREPAINRHRCFSANPEGIGVIQPRVARNKLPWVGVNEVATPKGLNPVRLFSQRFPVQPFQGRIRFEFTQGRRCYANPGLNDRNPFRIAQTGIAPDLITATAIDEQHVSMSIKQMAGICRSYEDWA